MLECEKFPGVSSALGSAALVGPEGRTSRPHTREEYWPATFLETRGRGIHQTDTNRRRVAIGLRIRILMI
jgi:hypothetical protein